MKKLLIIGAVVIVALAALGVAGFAFAQSQTPPTPDSPDGYSAPGWGQGGWHRGGGMWGDGAYGPMHEYMIEAMAQAFDMTVEELEALHDEGKTMWDVAQERGLSEEQFYDLMREARTQALEQAVADGVITQEQADWMLERMQGMWSGGGYGPCHGGGWGGRGRGGGRWNTQPAAPTAPEA